MKSASRWFQYADPSGDIPSTYLLHRLSRPQDHCAARSFIYMTNFSDTIRK
jgi:hypothetical protein